jgi:hypothetical protein
VRYLVKTGRLGYARVGRRVVIPAAELERLLRRATVKAGALLDGDEPIRPQKRNAPEVEAPSALHVSRDVPPPQENM